MPRIETVRRERKMKEVFNAIPKHVLKSLNDRLEKLSTNECITVTIPNIEIEVSCVWDEGFDPTLDFCDESECPEDMLRNATDRELTKLGLSSIIKLRERVKKEIFDWNAEVERVEKAYGLEENLLYDFLYEGWWSKSR